MTAYWVKIIFFCSFSLSSPGLASGYRKLTWPELPQQTKDAAEEAEVDEKTAIQSTVCSWQTLNHHSPLMLSGQGVVVQIDESLF